LLLWLSEINEFIYLFVINEKLMIFFLIFFIWSRFGPKLIKPRINMLYVETAAKKKKKRLKNDLSRF
jgi:hypothetical protein